MPEENKLGTSVTYLDPNGKKKPVRIAGVSLEPNKATDLADFFPQERAERLAQQLSTNPHFQVEGGPDNSGQLEDLAAARFDHEQKVQETYRKQQEARRPLSETELREPEAPADYDAPDQPTLENAPRVDPDDVVPTPTRKSKSK